LGWGEVGEKFLEEFDVILKNDHSELRKNQS
jgi:hypothetical protein